MNKLTLEQWSERDHDIHRYIREETVLVSTSSFINNSCEAQVVVTFDLPDGRTLSCYKTIRLTFKEVRE